MRREGKEQAAFIAGLEAARRIVERERLYAFRVLGAPSVSWRNGWDAGAASTRNQISIRIRREKAKGKTKR